MIIGPADYGQGAAVANSNFGLLYPPAPPDSGRPSVCAICPSIPPPPNGNDQTTTTSAWTGTFTTTITATDAQGGTDTVIVEVPSNFETTKTSTWTGTFTTTVTQTDTQGGTDTVIVEVPSNSESTITSTWTGSFTTTITQTDTQGGTDTVIVEVPSNSETTKTSTWTGTFTTTVTQTDTQGGTDTVIVEVPSNSESTITSTWTGAFTTTVTLTDTQGGTDTVIVELPTSSQSTSSSVSSSTPTAEGCSSVNPSAVGFIGYFYEYSTSDSLSSYLEGGYRSNKLEDTVEGIVDVEIVYESANTLDLEGYFLPPLSGSYKFELSNVANGASLSIGADVAFPCRLTFSKRAKASPLIIEGPSGTGELTVELVAGIYYPISIVNNYIASGEHIKFIITGPNGALSVDQTIFYIEQGETGISSTGFVSSSTTAVSSSSASTSETHSSSFPSSSFTSSSGYWSNSSVASTNWPSSAYSLSSTSSSTSLTVTSVTPSASAETDTTTTKTNISTTVITVTSCDHRKCTVTPVTTGVTVVTISTEDVVTEYTTYCPLPTPTANDITFTKTDISTTVITVTSCDDKKCTTTPVTTGVTVFTATVDEVVTEYTTYCPLPSESTSANEEDNNHTVTPIVPGSGPETISTQLPEGPSAIVTKSSSQSIVYSKTLDIKTYSTAYSTAVSSSSNSQPAIITVSEGKAVASFNIPVIAVFLTYLVHMFL